MRDGTLFQTRHSCPQSRSPMERSRVLRCGPESQSSGCGHNQIVCRFPWRRVTLWSGRVKRTTCSSCPHSVTDFFTGLTPDHTVRTTCGHLTLSLVTFDPLPAVIPESSRQRVRQWLLHETNSDLSVSRPRSRLYWGVPVPNDNSQTVKKCLFFKLSFIHNL